MVLRATAARLSCGSNRRQRPSPRRVLSRASSAARIRRSKLLAWSGNNAAPVCARRLTSQPAIRNGRARASVTATAVAPADSAPAAFGTSRAKRSPPIRAAIGGTPVTAVRRRANWRRRSSPKLKPCRPLMSRRRAMSITSSSCWALSARARSSNDGAVACIPAAESRPVSPSRSGGATAGATRWPKSAISLAASRQVSAAPAGERAKSRNGRTIVRCCQLLRPRLPAAIASENRRSAASVPAEPELSQPQCSVTACAMASAVPTNGATSRTAATVGRLHSSFVPVHENGE